MWTELTDLGWHYSSQSCSKKNWGYGDRILKRYPGPSKSQSRIFTIIGVRSFDVQATQTLLSHCVEMNHHCTFSAIALTLLSLVCTQVSSCAALSPACLPSSSTDISVGPEEQSSASFHTPKHRSRARAAKG